MASLTVFSIACAVAAMPIFAEPTVLDQGYSQMYNLQFEDAHRSFANWAHVHPDDPMGPVSDAAAYLFSELDRMNVLQSEFFTRDHKLVSRDPLTPDPAVKQKFEDALDRGRRLSDRILATAPNDKNAMFAAVLRNGLLSNYMALVEKRFVPALEQMKDGRMMAEKLLAMDSQYYDANLAIGIENYILGVKSAPVRFFLRLGRAQVDKAEGIQRLRLVAEKGHYLRPFARLLLAVAALRDNDRSKAKELLAGLAAEYPRNTLYARELARLNRG